MAYDIKITYVGGQTPSTDPGHPTEVDTTFDVEGTYESHLTKDTVLHVQCTLTHPDFNGGSISQTKLAQNGSWTFTFTDIEETVNQPAVKVTAYLLSMAGETPEVRAHDGPKYLWVEEQEEKRSPERK